MLFVCFYSVPNLIVILLNLLYLYLLWDLIVMGYVLERVCVKTQAIEAKRVLVGISQLSFSQSEACALHMTAMRRISTGWRPLCLASISQVRPSHETPARHFVSPVCIMKYTLSVPTLYILIYYP